MDFHENLIIGSKIRTSQEWTFNFVKKKIWSFASVKNMYLISSIYYEYLQIKKLNKNYIIISLIL